jgi:hypothetical protein
LKDLSVGFEGGTIFKGLSDITGHMEGFFLGPGVFGAVEIAGILEIVGVIVGTVGIGAARDAGSSCARHSKREVS